MKKSIIALVILVALLTACKNEQMETENVIHLAQLIEEVQR